MGPETLPDGVAPGRPPDEEEPTPANGHHVAPRRPDGPVLDEVTPLIPLQREHHGG